MRRDIKPAEDRQAPDAAWHRLAEALGEDVLVAPSESLLAEALEDHGDRRSLASAFDRVVDRSVVTAKRRRLRMLGAGVLSDLGSALAWKPVLASIGVVLIALVASDVYIRISENAPNQQVASAPLGDAPTRIPADGVRPRMVERRDADASPSAVPRPSLSHDALPTPREAAHEAAAMAPQSLAAASEARQAPAPLSGTKHSGASEQTTSQAAGAAASLLTPQDKAAVALPSASRADPAPPTAAATAGATPTSFIWPVQGHIIASFGPVAGRMRNDGIDIAVPEGTDIRVADDGVVVYAGEDAKGYGNLVLVRHDTGFVTAYAYASKLLVNLGDVVRRGDVIAQSGKSSESHQPELHFEIRRGAVPINPMTLLPPLG
jgi:murein DD-endopeptidase MepM/ murein hydrolase activator NlpD